MYKDWIAIQAELQCGSEEVLGHGRPTYRNIRHFDPPELPAWLIHVPEPDGTTTALLVFATSPPGPGEKLELRFPWAPEYVVVTAVVMIPVRRVPRGVVEQAWMGAALRDCLFVEMQGDGS